jgi:hypothetical protein
MKGQLARDDEEGDPSVGDSPSARSPIGEARHKGLASLSTCPRPVGRGLMARRSHIANVARSQPDNRFAMREKFAQHLQRALRVAARAGSRTRYGKVPFTRLRRGFSQENALEARFWHASPWLAQQCAVRFGWILMRPAKTISRTTNATGMSAS